MALNSADFITRNVLESSSIRYANEQKDYIADEVFHPLPVNKEQIKLWQYDTSNYRRVVTKKHSKAKADVVDYSGFYSNRTCELHKLQGEVDPKDARNFDAPVAQVETDTMMTVMDRLLIDKEVEAYTLAGTTTNYPSDLTSALGAGVTWAVDGGDPEADAKTARIAVKARCGRAPNALALSWTAFQHLSNNAALKDRVKYTSGQSLTVDQLKNLLQLQYIFVCAAMQNTNVEGNATQTLAEIWGDEAIFYVYNPSPKLKKVCYGIQPIFNRLYSRKWQDNERGSGDGPIEMMELGWSYDLDAGAVISSSDGDFAAGYCLDNVF